MPLGAFVRTLPERPGYHWWVFGVISAGTFLTVVDIGSLNIALPTIGRHFNASLPSVQWLVLANSLTISVLLLPMGRLGDLHGRRSLYILGFAIFVAGAAVGAVAINLPMLIGARVLQGIGSALVQGNSIAMTLTLFTPEERGKALGLTLAVVGISGVVAPSLGGFLVGALGWRSIFLVTFGIGVCITLLSFVLLDRHRFRPASPSATRPQFDWPGAVLSGLTLLLFLLAMTNGNRLGWTSPLILSGAAAAVLMLGLFITRELTAATPMLELRLFRRLPVTLGVATAWTAFMGTSAILFLTPFYLQNVQGLSPQRAGLILIPGSFAMAVTAVLSGRLADRFGSKRFAMAGMACSVAALFLFASFLRPASSLILIVPCLVLMFAGHGLFNSPNLSGILSAVEQSRYGVMTALMQLVRNSGNIVGNATAVAVVVATMGSLGFEPNLAAVTATSGQDVAASFVTGVRHAYIVIGSLLALGFIMSAIPLAKKLPPTQA